MRFVSTRARGGEAGASLRTALFEGLAPDGGLYVPERIPSWTADDVAALPARTLVEIGTAALGAYTAGDLDGSSLARLLAEALTFPIPLVEIEPGIHALELFHGPTLAFKDVGARVMARLIAALHDRGAAVTILVATSGDTGGAVAHAFHNVPHTRVVSLYPEARVSPTQEAQLTMFNGDTAGNVRAYAVAGSFDDCQRLVKAAFADPVLQREVRLTSANSINVGRLLPQTIYYFHAVAQLQTKMAAGPDFGPGVLVSVPSGNFGNLTAGVMARRAGLPVARFVAATNVNDVVPAYLATGIFEARASVQTIANAMDVGNPSNFERLLWLYESPAEAGHYVRRRADGRYDDRDCALKAAAMARDIAGSRHDDHEVRATIRRVYDERGYILDPHAAIAYLGLKAQAERKQAGQAGIFLATAHPAKFPEVVEPIVGHRVEPPPSLADALARPRHTRTIPPTLAALSEVLQTSNF